jgi:hypothetical protein
MFSITRNTELVTPFTAGKKLSVTIAMRNDFLLPLPSAPMGSFIEACSDHTDGCINFSLLGIFNSLEN